MAGMKRFSNNESERSSLNGRTVELSVSLPDIGYINRKSSAIDGVATELNFKLLVDYSSNIYKFFEIMYCYVANNI